MLFNSIEFLFFLPIVFLLYWFVFKNRQWQNLLIVVASYVFYGWWDWRFLFLIALTSFCSYASGVLMERYEGRRRQQRYVSAANIVLNLLILGLFKYFNFFVESLNGLFLAMGLHLDWVTLNIVLPVGISFYTFQALSYTIDVYQGKLKATHDPVAFFAYISFFPQLVAGPIERATRLLPQFQQPRRFDYAKAVDGCRQMLWGFFKKMVVADNCGTVVLGPLHNGPRPAIALRGHPLHHPDLLRLLRLFRHRHRQCPPVWLRPDEELRLPAFLAEHPGVLAQMAYLLNHLVSRLCVFPLGG